MPLLTTITLNDQQHTVTFCFDDGSQWQFLAEYLRVFAPTLTALPANKRWPPHLQNIDVTDVEFVGKHGYRLYFSDDFHAVFSVDYLIDLADRFEQNWQHYLSQIKTLGIVREQRLTVKQL
jgi:DUF971 family protein